MNKGPVAAALALSGTIITGCGSSLQQRASEPAKPTFIVQAREPIAIMPFETESALSNLGGQLSDEVIVNLLQHAPELRIVPTSVVRSFLAGANLPVGGMPDAHSIHQLKEGLRCRYLLTGNLYTSIGEVQYSESYRNRIASGSVTVRLVDCDSVRVVWARHVESNYSTTLYYSTASRVPTTSLTDGQLLTGLIRNLAEAVAANFYPNRR